MSYYPKIVIVGRPNVGKSALFNRICSKRIAIVDEAEGVTRDRIYADAEFCGRYFCLVDTGGIDANSKAPFNAEIQRQSQIAIEEGDALVMVVDGRVGITDLDLALARRLLTINKPLYLAVNKIDNITQQVMVYPFAQLGIKNMWGVSAVQGYNIADMLEAILNDLFPSTEEEVEEDFAEVEQGDKPIKVALVGRPNVGKSTLMNQILEEDRCVVSPIPGTTRDNIDADIEFDGRLYRFIDTAGIRNRKAEHDVIDKFAMIRTESAIERTDVCILMLDATVGFTQHDKKIAKKIEESGKGCILIFNKWDLVKGFRMEHCKKAAQDAVAFLKHCPMLFISAQTGRNVHQIFELIHEIYNSAGRKISTGQLNRFVVATLQKKHPPALQGGKRLRIYYLTQVDTFPPHFILFVNNPTLMDVSYERFLLNQMRAHFGIKGVPIVLHLRGKKRDAEREQPQKGQRHISKEITARSQFNEQGELVVAAAAAVNPQSADDEFDDWEDEVECDNFFIEEEPDLEDKK
ncbi:MAG: GTPase Der [Chlamydiales bacterium]|jgi:GTP-binding protein|nr:GTPase Der [Chlamydiales bacterium]